jgi:hypothetical protein
LLHDPQETDLGRVLGYVEAIERGDWEAADGFRLDLSTPAETYVQSLQWANEFKHAA